MAGNIKGIIVEIGGDTSGLEKALKSANSASAKLSKELRGINSLLKLDPKNTELLAQKQTVLREKIGETTKKLEALKEAQRRYIESGGDLNSSKYRDLQREIIKTENELKNLRLETSSWTSLSGKLSDISDKMKGFGDKVSEAGKKVSTLSLATAGFFAAGTKYNSELEKYTKSFETFLGSAEEAENVVNNIKKQSQKSPFDTNELIKANQLLIAAGDSADHSQKTISALADAVALTGGGNDELTRMASNLQQIQNAGKATAMDIRQFAYAGIDVYGILSDYTGKTTEELKKMDITYEDLSGALQAAASEGGKYYEGQQKMSETLTGQIGMLKKTFSELTGELSEALYPTIKAGVEKLQGFVNWFKNLDDGTKTIITKIGVFITALGPALVIIGKLISGGGQIFGVLSKVTGVVAKVSSGFGGLSGVISALASPIGIIVAAIGALIAAFVYLFNTDEDFRNQAMETWQGIVDMFQNTVMPIFQEVWGVLSEVIGQIIEIFQQLWENIQPIVTEMLEWLMDFWNNTLKGIVEKVLTFVGKLIEFRAKIYNEFILPLINFLMETLWPIIEWVIKNVIEKAQDVMTHIGKVIDSIMGVLNGIIDFVTGIFTGDWEKAWQGVQDIFSNLMGGLWEIIKWPLNQIIKGVNNLIDGLNNIKVPDWVPGIGGKSMNIPHIPELAKGGIVSEATLAVIGEGQSSEAVIPLDRTLTRYMAEAMKMAGGERNIVVNFYPQQMTDEELDRCFNYVDRRYGMEY